MRKKDFWFTVILIAVLTLITLVGRAQQKLVYSKQLWATDSIKLGGVWRSSWPAVAAAGWNLTGNTGTNAATNFTGTLDAVDFVTRTNNIERLRVSSGAAGSQLFKINGTGITNGIVDYVAASSVTTGIGLYVDGNSITTGRIAEFATASTGNFTNGAVKIGASNAHTGNLLSLLDASTAATIQNIIAPALTTGTGLEVNSSSNSLNSTNGLLYINNSGNSVNGILARFRANSNAGSGVTIKANGNTGFGTSNPVYTVDIVGGFKLTNGSQAAGYVLTSDGSGVATWAAPVATVTLPETRIAFGGVGNVLSYSNNLTFTSGRFFVANGYDGVMLSEGVNADESGLYSGNADQMIAVYDVNSDTYSYANGNLNYSNADDKLNVSGKINLGSTTDYINNAAALLGGLVVGDVYRTGDILKIVH